MFEELGASRRRLISTRFFEVEALDIEQAEKQKKRLQTALDNCEVRLQALIEKPPYNVFPFEDWRDTVAVYLLFRCLEYADECLKVTSIYGLLPLVRCLYEHFVKIHWAILSEENCVRFVEASRFRQLERAFLMYDRDKKHREYLKKKYDRREISVVRKEYVSWKGQKQQPDFKGMAKEAGLEDIFAEFTYPLLSERAHGSGWEELGQSWTGAEEFTLMLGFAGMLLNLSTDAVEGWVSMRSLPNVAIYSQQAIFSE